MTKNDILTVARGLRDARPLMFDKPAPIQSDRVLWQQWLTAHSVYNQCVQHTLNKIRENQKVPEKTITEFLAITKFSEAL
jgi:hypothetical protein